VLMEKRAQKFGMYLSTKDKLHAFFCFAWSILSSYALKSHFRFVNCEHSTFYIIFMFESKKSELKLL
jgi:hypothetical protein